LVERKQAHAPELITSIQASYCVDIRAELRFGIKSAKHIFPSSEGYAFKR
jgi:hypothetical protein